MSQFQTQCRKLFDAGVQPQDVVDVARVTQCSEVLTAAFPTMPPSLRERLYDGATDIECTTSEDWVLKHLEPR